jgi:hypothetical protein
MIHMLGHFSPTESESEVFLQLDELTSPTMPEDDAKGTHVVSRYHSTGTTLHRNVLRTNHPTGTSRIYYKYTLMVQNTAMIRCWSAATLLWTSHAFSARSTCPPVPVRVDGATALSATSTSSYPQVDQRTGKPTGVSFLPAATIERAQAGTPVEKVKLEKDGTAAFVDVYEYARKIRAGEMTWEEVDKADLDSVRCLDVEARVCAYICVPPLHDIKNDLCVFWFSLLTLLLVFSPLKNTSGSNGLACCTATSALRVNS